MDQGKSEKSLFWADQLAEKIVKRQTFYFTDQKIPKFDKYVVKSAASVSGVLHIGRLSDTIRCDAVFKALNEMGHKAEFIWTADNVDPLRKIPEGVPKSYDKYIGMPVTDVPDPWGCHKSYEEHHKETYLEVVNKFIHDKMKIYSMREEYLKGTFREYIKIIMKNYKTLVEIQNKYRKEGMKLRTDWSPWQPICENCGKIITTKVTKILEDGRVEYVCQDYQFKVHKAKGCGHKGVNNPSKGNGKLLYKGELAVQWAHWNVVSEGFGKEYQVPGSAFWINGEIVEKILKFPMPEPIFYEHLIIDGTKMSASLGNIVYPSDWLKVATPELLRFFYDKKLMKTRSFSWKDLPKLYDDYDNHEAIFFGKKVVENKKEEEHMKRLYDISQIKRPNKMPEQIPFDFSVMIAQIVPEKGFLDHSLKILETTGHIKDKPSSEDTEFVKKRLDLAKNWARLYAPEQYKFELKESVSESVKNGLTDKEKQAIKFLSKSLSEKKMSEEELLNLFYKISKEDLKIEPKRFFEIVYLVLIGKSYGPRLAPFILAIGQKRIAELLSNV